MQKKPKKSFTAVSQASSMEMMLDTESVKKYLNTQEGRFSYLTNEQVKKPSSTVFCVRGSGSQVYDLLYASTSPPFEKDFTIRYNNDQICKVHKSMTMKVSKMISRIGKSELILKKKISQKHQVAFEHFIKFAYNCPSKIHHTLFFYFYEVCDFFRAEGICREMEDFFSVKNAITLLREYEKYLEYIRKHNLSQLNDCSHLLEFLLKIIITSFDEVNEKDLTKFSQIKNEQTVFRIIENEGVQKSKKYQKIVNEWLNENFLKIDFGLSKKMQSMENYEHSLNFENRLYALLEKKAIGKDENNICFFIVWEKRRNKKTDFKKSLNIFSVYFDMISNENLLYLSQFLTIDDLKVFLKQIKTQDYSKLLRFLLNYPNVIELGKEMDPKFPHKSVAYKVLLNLIENHVDFSSVGMNEFIRFVENEEIPSELLRRSTLEFLYGLNERLCDLGIPGFKSLVDDTRSEFDAVDKL